MRKSAMMFWGALILTTCMGLVLCQYEQDLSGMIPFFIGLFGLAIYDIYQDGRESEGTP